MASVSSGDGYGNAPVVGPVHGDVGAVGSERVESIDAESERRTDTPGVAGRLR